MDENFKTHLCKARKIYTELRHWEEKQEEMDFQDSMIDLIDKLLRICNLEIEND